MAKLNLNLQDLKGFVLSPGNIFWQQKSGAYVLLSAKSDFLNIELIEKLSRTNHSVQIENQINLQIQHDFISYFSGHQSEMLVKEKLQWRSKLISLFSRELGNDEVSQFEVDQLAWIVFSKVDEEKAHEFLARDIDLFKRSMSVSSSYTLCAFMLGYYSDEFLSKLFTKTFLDLMDLKMSLPLQTLKMKLEKIRNLESLQVEDKQILEEVYQLNKKPDVLLGERYDGSGFRQINKCEMSDLELVLVALSDHYSFSSSSHKSIFYEIKNSFFNCDEKILNVLKKCMDIKQEAAPHELGA